MKRRMMMRMIETCLWTSMIYFLTVCTSRFICKIVMWQKEITRKASSYCQSYFSMLNQMILWFLQQKWGPAIIWGILIIFFIWFVIPKKLKCIRSQNQHAVRPTKTLWNIQVHPNDIKLNYFSIYLFYKNAFLTSVYYFSFLVLLSSHVPMGLGPYLCFEQ